MDPITAREVWVMASNASIIANCQCPSRYFNTKWEPIWRQLREEWFEYFTGAQSDKPTPIEA